MIKLRTRLAKLLVGCTLMRSGTSEPESPVHSLVLFMLNGDSNDMQLPYTQLAEFLHWSCCSFEDSLNLSTFLSISLFLSILLSAAILQSCIILALGTTCVFFRLDKLHWNCSWLAGSVQAAVGLAFQETVALYGMCEPISPFTALHDLVAMGV